MDATPLKVNRKAWFPKHGTIETPVLNRARLAAGSQVRGPAIIESLDSTVVIAPGWRARIDAKGFIRMTRGEEMDLANV